jgi:hypothetical protein
MIGVFHLRGEASGRILRLATPLSFWGGVDAESGRIIDRSQTACGTPLAGRILVMPSGRGSSSASSVLAETIRNGTGPAGIVMQRPDPIVTAGAMVARALYSTVCPVVVAPIDTLEDNMTLHIRDEDGEPVLELS